MQVQSVFVDKVLTELAGEYLWRLLMGALSPPRRFRAYSPVALVVSSAPEGWKPKIGGFGPHQLSLNARGVAARRPGTSAAGTADAADRLRMSSLGG